MNIFCKFPTVNISKLNFWLVICIAKNIIWTERYLSEIQLFENLESEGTTISKDWVICIAKKLIWTTLNANFSIFWYCCTLRFQISQRLYLRQILSYHNKPYINGNLIYSALIYIYIYIYIYISKLYIYIYVCVCVCFKILNIMTGLVVQVYICRPINGNITICKWIK